mmetsp:Transcript_26395/g.79150  ORF Transcript_26395/g.79150 Transcript_26395/m.79150 type:complete len:252 (+) Transcript_26395:136-891(+)
MRGSCSGLSLYFLRSAARSSGLSGVCAGTSLCSVMSTRSSASRKCSMRYMEAISCSAVFANGVMPCFTTRIAWLTLASFIISQYCLMVLTPTFSSSGRKTKTWSSGSASCSARIVRSFRFGWSPYCSWKSLGFMSSCAASTTKLRFRSIFRSVRRMRKRWFASAVSGPPVARGAGGGASSSMGSSSSSKSAIFAGGGRGGVFGRARARGLGGRGDGTRRRGGGKNQARRSRSVSEGARSRGASAGRRAAAL